MNEMSVMSREGDTKIKWSPTDPASVNVAREAFNDYVGQGFRPFAMEGNGGSQMTAFDPTVGQIVFLCPLSGG